MSERVYLASPVSLFCREKHLAAINMSFQVIRPKFTEKNDVHGTLNHNIHVVYVYMTGLPLV